MMITKEFAAQFAQDWIAAWNSHDMAKIMALYADDFTINSPTALAVAAESNGFISGKENIRNYWQRAMELAPGLEFKLLRLFVGINGIALHLINTSFNKEVTEVMQFNEAGKVAQVLVYHLG
jgi:ketosteroid isomerase-like protein